MKQQQEVKKFCSFLLEIIQIGKQKIGSRFVGQKKPNKGLNWTTINEEKEIKRLFKIQNLKKKEWENFLQKEFKDLFFFDKDNKKFLSLLLRLKTKI